MTKYGDLDRVVPWLAVGRGKRSRVRRAHGIYRSKAEAENRWSGNLGLDEMVWTYEKDRPGLKVVHEGFTLVTREIIKSREIWLRRHRTVIGRMSPRKVRTTVLTYDRDRPKDALSHALGTWNGPCALPAGMSWPMCAECEAPLAYFVTLDFRQAVGVEAPRASLVIHMCPKHWYEARSTSLVWINPTARFRVAGDDLHVRSATQWRLLDYDVDVADDDADFAAFREERSLNLNFICHGTKIGGMPNWEQGAEVPMDKAGKPMAFIAQVLGGGSVEMGDSGCLYLFHSKATGETKPVMQCL